MPDDVKVLAVIRSYRDLHTFLRARMDEMDMRRLDSDGGSGLAEGYTGKLLGAAMVRKIGPRSLGPLLTVADVDLVAVPRDAPVKRPKCRPA